MVTIEVPLWMQWAGLLLAFSYAIPKALRVLIVLWVYASTLCRRGKWPCRVADGRGHEYFTDADLRHERDLVADELVGWAFRFNTIQMHHTKWPPDRQQERG